MLLCQACVSDVPTYKFLGKMTACPGKDDVRCCLECRQPFEDSQVGFLGGFCCGAATCVNTNIGIGINMTT